ncbi:amidohydrolase [Corynebacterium sanguinis]|uniref:amidohydrolase n=1 Tax=Corynebacterium sanguinis TaxID=2594913 RepID=UPI00119CCE89|nr:amidohydrolase [Corynebacterium sanguinis]MCT1627533.1 amidohydrolase [Corynebacterium sanguinis]TVS25225.1 amidohydrolase [Corynebacterium sanguinis]
MNDISAILDSYEVDPVWQRRLYELLHANPELSMQEEETHRRILHELKRFDCEVISPIGTYGVVAVFHNGEGPTVLFRADFDGLPVTEDTNVSYASHKMMTGRDGKTVGTMHACGHDIHTTALLSLCDFLDHTRDSWSGTFVALFQPGEETSEGAMSMVDDDLTSRVPRPAVCFGQHVMPGRAGQVMSKAGPQFAACDSIRIVIPGRSAHGSMPHNAIDPTYTAAMIITRMQAIVGREVDPNDFAVISVGTMRAGSVTNIIPASAELTLNCRFYSDKTKEKVCASIERVVHAEVLASGMTEKPTIEYFAHGELLTNDATVYSKVRPTFDAVFGKDSVNAPRKTVSEDFPFIPMAFGVPYFFWLIGCTPREQWDVAVAADRVAEDVPVNHMANFLPEYEPTINAATRAAAAAVLTYLAG